MRVHKLSAYISLVLMFITILFSIICTFNNELKNNEVLIFINSISLNIFAGVIVLFGTSLISYFYERKRAMEKVLIKNIDFSNNYRKIKYFNREIAEKFEDFEKDIKKSNIEVDKNSIKVLYQRLIKKNKEKEEENLKEIIRFYIELREKLVLGELWDAYGDLDFLCDIGNKTKNYLYNDFFKFISDIHIKIGEYINLFKSYLDNGTPNYEMVRESLESLQNNIFKVAEKSIEDIKKENYLNTDIKRRNTLLTVNCTNGNVCIYENIISEKLDVEYNRISEITWA